MAWGQVANVGGVGGVCLRRRNCRESVVKWLRVVCKCVILLLMKQRFLHLSMLLGLSTLLACSQSDPNQSEASESAVREKHVQKFTERREAKAGDIQIVGLEPGMDGINIEFRTSQAKSVSGVPAGNHESFIQLFFTKVYLGPKTTNAIAAPEEIFGKQFAPGAVRLEISSSSDEKSKKTWYENRETIVVSKNTPNVLRIDTFKKD